MGGISEKAIRERAYHIWEREGRPHGRDFEHWVQAQVELDAEATKQGAPEAATSRSAAPQAAAQKASRPAPVRAQPARAKRPA